MTNEQARQELSFGLAKQDMADMQFRITHHDMQPREKIVIELIEWPRDEL